MSDASGQSNPTKISDSNACDLNSVSESNTDSDCSDTHNVAKNAAEVKLQCPANELIAEYQSSQEKESILKNDPSDHCPNVNSISNAKKSAKRVNFPEDVIHGYHEPPAPWNEVSGCSTEDLLAAYKQSCLKHDVKPLPKLLQQLKAITNFQERNETLTVRGENLNVRHSETLEEILRRVQFRTIDLEASHLDEESAIAIFDMIEFYHSAIRINISYNKIGLRGWQSCCRMLKKTPCVQNLEARCCSLTEQVLPIFGRALRLGSQLRIMHLENSINSGRSLIILVAALKMNDIVEEVFLADNKLMPSDGIQLGNLLKFNHKLKVLDVRSNHLGDVGTTHISDGLFEQNNEGGLGTLVLWNNQITFQSMPSLSRALKSTKNLETLNIGHNNLTNEGIHRLKDGLLQNRSLLRVGFSATKISCEGAVALAECIAESSLLHRLDLRENEIKTGGLMALALALKVNQSVNRIDVDQSPKKESGLPEYANQQRKLIQDIASYSERNRELYIRKEEEKRNQQLKAEVQATLTEIEETKVLPSADSIEKVEIVQKVELPSEYEANDRGNGTNCIKTDKEVIPDTTERENELSRMNLHLPIASRSQLLDSPGNHGDIDYSSVQTFNDSIEESPLAPEFPPSPMVSHDGKTIHAEVVNTDQCEPHGQLKSILAHDNTETSPSSFSSGVDILQQSKVEKAVPLKKRKFKISRVVEANENSSNMHSEHYSNRKKKFSQTNVELDSSSISDKQIETHLSQNIANSEEPASSTLASFCSRESTSIHDESQTKQSDTESNNQEQTKLYNIEDSETLSILCPMNNQFASKVTSQTTAINNTQQIDALSKLQITEKHHNTVKNIIAPNESVLECDSQNVQCESASKDELIREVAHSVKNDMSIGGSVNGNNISCSDESNILSLNAVRIDVNDLLDGAGDCPTSQIAADSASSSLG